MNVPIRPRPLRGLAPRRLTRPADRLEAAVSVLLLTAALMLLWGSFFAGHRVADQTREQYEARAAGAAYHAIGTVTDTELPVRPPLPPGDGINASWRTPVVWTAPDGTPRREELLLPGPRSTGDAVPVVVRHDGTATADGDGLDPGTIGFVTGFVILLTGWGCLGLVWVGTERAFVAWNCRGWAAEWRAVEPQWSGRRS